MPENPTPEQAANYFMESDAKRARRFELYNKILNEVLTLERKKVAQLKAELQQVQTERDVLTEQLQQAQEEIAAWEVKAALFVDQGDEIERLRKERDALVQSLDAIEELRSKLDDLLGDTDLDWWEDEEDLIEKAPLQWVHMEIIQATRKEIEPRAQ